MAVKLGTNPIAWSNDDMPELGGDTPLETCLAEAALAGFKGIEKGGKFPNDAASIARNRLSLGSQVPPRATKRSVASTIGPLRSPSEGGLRNLPSTRAIC